jgi:hypothetical protein
MRRLIEIDPTKNFPTRLRMKIGDVIELRASGARLQDNTTVLEIAGFFTRSVVGNNYEVLTPIGAPNTVLILVHGPGEAIVEVITGDPWRSTKISHLQVTVEE